MTTRTCLSDQLADDAKVKCDDCDWTGVGLDLDLIADIHLRVAPGEPYPAGECPECGCLCHLVQEEINPYDAVIGQGMAQIIKPLAYVLDEPERAALNRRIAIYSGHLSCAAGWNGHQADWTGTLAEFWNNNPGMILEELQEIGETIAKPGGVFMGGGGAQGLYTITLLPVREA